MTDFAVARKAMVDSQVRPNGVTQLAIVQAMLEVPRELFVPKAQRAVAYAGESVRIADGRWLADPMVFAKLVSAASIDADDVVLDIGCGTGYSAAILSRLAGAVIALEEDEQLAEEATRRLADVSADNVAVVKGPLAEGYASDGPYDVILLEGSVAEVPDALIGQLKPGGRLVAVVQTGAMGDARVYVRGGDEGEPRASARSDFDAALPPLPGFEREEAFAF